MNNFSDTNLSQYYNEVQWTKNSNKLAFTKVPKRSQRDSLKASRISQNMEADNLEINLDKSNSFKLHFLPVLGLDATT